MRLMIETTTSEPQYSIREIIEVPYDDVNLEEALALMYQLLQGYGYPIKLEDKKYE